MRRRDRTLGGRWIAGELGDLFVETDGVRPLWDTQATEVFPDAEVAAAAWERARVRTWRHEDREWVWPPAGAIYDGLVSRTERCVSASRERLSAAVEADLADLASFRRERPDAAAQIADELDEYAHALELLAGWFARPAGMDARTEAWLRITRRGGSDRGQVA